MATSKKKNQKARKRSRSHQTLQQEKVVNQADDSPELPEIPRLPIPEQYPFSSKTALQEWRQSVDAWIREQGQQLENVLLQYNAYDMIANLTITQLGTNPETYKEVTHEGLAAIVEYVALLYLKHPFSMGETPIIDGPALEEVHSRTHQILQATLMYYATETFPQDIEKVDSTLDQFRYQTISNELLVRSPGYAHHQGERLVALFSPLEDWMLEHLGFTIGNVLLIDQSIETITDRKFTQRREKAKQSEQEMLATLQSARNGKKSETVDDFIQSLLHLPLKDAKKYIKNSVMGWMFFFLGTGAFSFTAEEISEETNLPSDRVTSVLQFFSLEFGSIRSDFYMLSPTHELKTKPFLHHNDTYLCPLPGSLVWAVQSRLEESLNPGLSSPTSNKVLWEKYKDKRAEYLEHESLRLFGLALKHADVYHSLSYEIVQDGLKKRTELDGLVTYDATLFLIETKAGTFTPSARRGSKDRMRKNLKQLMGDAHSQAVRAKRYIDANDTPRFTLKDGKKVIIDKDRFRRIFLVTVTLEPLDMFNAMLFDVAKTGVFEEAELPWAVSLDVLRVICEINEFPAQLIHYLLRRLRLNEFQNIRTHDELDWFGLYLERGLYFEDTKMDETNLIQVLSHTTAFDDYYFYEMGLRKTPVQKPVQPMPKLLREIITQLEEQHDSVGYSEAIIQLLDWSDASRKQFVKLFERIRKIARRDQQMHDASLLSNNGRAGITCIAATSQNDEDAFNRLVNYVQAKKYQQKAQQWIGILTLVDKPGLVHGFITGLAPWVFNEELESLAATLPSSTLE